MGSTNIKSLTNRIFTKLTAILSTWCKTYRTWLLLPKFKSVGKKPNFNFPIYKHGLSNVVLGDNFHCGERLKLRTFSDWRDKRFKPEIIIGNNVNIESDCHISAINSVIIDDNVLIASFVYISDHAHGEISAEILTTPPLERPLVSKGPVRICKNVWLGEKVTILPGVTVGEGSIIGANSVVTKDIPPFCVACGCPAKIIKKLK